MQTWRGYHTVDKRSKIIIYLPEEDVYGEIEQVGAYGSLVSYYLDGIYCKVMVPNEDFVIVDELIIYSEEEEN